MPTKTQQPNSVEHIAERKCKITGRVHSFEKVQAVKGGGFHQFFMLHIPEQKDELTGRIFRREQYYRIEIYSQQEDDKRFLDSRNIRELRCCSVYLNSYHWADNQKINYGQRLNFHEWLKVEK